MRTIALFAVLLFVSPAWADLPRVAFDAPRTIEFRDVTPAEWAAAHPDRKLIEAVMKVSLRLESGKEADLEGVVYEFRPEVEGMTIVDHLPGSEMADLFADGTADVVIRSEEGGQVAGYARGSAIGRWKGAGVGFGLTGVGAARGETEASGEAGVSGSARFEKASRVEATALMPRRLVLASGTLDRATGVYWKLQPHRAAGGPEAGLTDARLTHTLQTQRVFSVVLDVPAGLRGAVAGLWCAATGTDRGRVYDNPGADAGSILFSIGLHQAGDIVAKAAVRERLEAGEAAVEAEAARVTAADEASRKRLEEHLDAAKLDWESVRPRGWEWVVATELIGSRSVEIMLGTGSVLEKAEEAAGAERERVLSEPTPATATADARLKRAEANLAGLNAAQDAHDSPAGN